MTYLVDANVLSELTKPAPNRRVVDWLSAHEGEFVVDPIVLGEMYAGILALQRGRKRTALERWFTGIERRIECIPWDAQVGLRWARLVIDLRIAGQAIPILDGMIAATALAHDLTLVTRNTRDFRKANVRVLNPFK